MFQSSKTLAGDLFRKRRHDSEIKNRKDDHTIRGKAGIPMVFDHNKKAYIRTGIPELRRPEDVDTTGDSDFRDEDEDMNTDQNSLECRRLETRMMMILVMMRRAGNRRKIKIKRIQKNWAKVMKR